MFSFVETSFEPGSEFPLAVRFLFLSSPGGWPFPILWPAWFVFGEAFQVRVEESRLSPPCQDVSLMSRFSWSGLQPSRAPLQLRQALVDVGHVVRVHHLQDAQALFDRSQSIAHILQTQVDRVHLRLNIEIHRSRRTSRLLWRCSILSRRW